MEKSCDLPGIVHPAICLTDVCLAVSIRTQVHTHALVEREITQNIAVVAIGMVDEHVNNYFIPNQSGSDCSPLPMCQRCIVIEAGAAITDHKYL